MNNPFEAPILAIGLLAGIIAGLIPGKQPIRWLNRIYILLSGAFLAWGLEIYFVDWAYTHPFDPNDGGPRTVVALLGWIVALINPILPTFAAVSVLRMLYTRFAMSRRAT